MSMIIVPNEWKEKKPFVYYSLHVWNDSKATASYSNDYDSCDNAVSVLRSQLKYDDNNHIELATIREHTIYRRTNDCELSTSSPIIHYDYKTGFRI